MRPVGETHGGTPGGTPGEAGTTAGVSGPPRPTAVDLGRPPPPGAPPTYSPPVPKEAPTDAQVRRSFLLVAVAAVVGIVVDVTLRGGVVGLGAALAISAVVIGVLVLVPDRPTERWVFSALAMLAACGLVWRTSPWIVILDWVAALGFVGLASSTSRERPIIGSSMARMVWRGAAPPAIFPVLGVAELAGSLDTIRRRPRRADHAPSALRQLAPAVGRGLLLAVPIVMVLGALLASADGVFASFFDVPTPSVENPFLHLALIGTGASVVAGLVHWSRDPIDPSDATGRPLGPVETLIVLAGLTVLYALFAVAQLLAAAGGDDRVRESTGLTYAEYARTGFFQLLWAAAITIVVLLGIRALARPGTARQQVATRIVSAATCALTLVVVGSAITRLGLYRDAYGLTMLRLACTTFAWLLGVAFLLLGARMLQANGRDWLPASYLAVAVVALGWWNVSNPEAVVVETNLDRATVTGKLDVDYLDTMSDDAIPAVLDGIERIPTALADEVRDRMCSPPGLYGSSAGRAHVAVDADGVVRARSGWAAFNVARQEAVRAVERCADRTTAPG